MTLTSEQQSVSYTSTASQTAFAVPFRFFADTDLKVLHNESGTETLISTSVYTVSGAGDASGGTVTFNSGLSNGTVVKINRVIPETQSLDLTTTGVFPAESIEEAFDRQVCLMQQSLSVDTTDGTTFDAESKRIVNVAEATASNDAINKATHDALKTRVLAVEQAAGVGPGNTLNVPDPNGEADNKFIATASNAYALKTAAQVRAALTLDTTDSVTHAAITANGDLTATGDVVLGTANTKDVTINNNLILGVDGQIRAASGNKVGLRVNHDQALGTLHILEGSGGATTTTPNALADTLILDSPATGATGMTIYFANPDTDNATRNGAIFFGNQGQNTRGGFQYQALQQVSSAGDDDNLFVKVGGANFAIFKKGATQGFSSLTMSQETQITNVRDPRAGSTGDKDAVNKRTVEALAGFRVAQFSAHAEVLSPGGQDVLSTQDLIISDNVGQGADNYNVFQNNTNWVTVTPGSNKWTLQPGTYYITCVGGLMVNPGALPTNIQVCGPYLTNNASTGAANHTSNANFTLTNIITDDGGHPLSPREGVRTGLTGNMNNERNPLCGPTSGIGGPNPFGATVVGIQGVKTISTTTDFFPHIVYKISQILNTGAMYNFTIQKLDGTV